MFEIYATMDQRMPPADVAAHAQRAEALGFDGLCVPEAVHDGIVAATVALGATTRLKVATSVLVAFPRSPMTLAVAAWDLQALSGGRFELGLGPQVRGNIVGRYSTAWSAPVPRMREYVGALRAIFDCWQNGAPLEFEGEHYRFTRMQPFFNPGPLEGLSSETPVPIWLGAIGPLMTGLAGEAADCMVTHPTNTAPRYIREVIQPRITKGAARAGRAAEALSLLIGPLTAVGRDAAGVAAERARQRELLTFLYSTPSYFPSLELFGWKEIGERLHALTRAGKWQEMAGLVSDEMLDTFVPSGTYEEIPEILTEWYGSLSTRLTFPLPSDPADDRLARKAVAALRGDR